MKKYRVTKKQVMEALLTEPLKQGSFFHNYNYNGVDSGDCKVCAVGAVLRSVKTEHFDDDDAYNAVEGIAASYQLDQAYDSNNFLSILSTEFERAAREYGEDNVEDTIRFHALMVAEGMCPDVVEFEIDK